MAQINVICSYTACAASFSFSIYLPYLRRAVVTSQIICDVTDVHYDAKKPSASENLSYLNQVLARSSVTRLRGKRGHLNYNPFFPEPTYNFLDHPSNQEVGPRGQTVPHDISNVRSTTRNCKISYSAPRASERGSMKTAAMLFTYSHVLWLMTSWKERPPMILH